MFRALQFISELRLFADCLMSCGMNIFWAVLVIVLMLLLFALFFVQAVTQYLVENQNRLDENEVLAFIKAFGSVEATMSVLFQSVTGGSDWGEYYKLFDQTGS